MRNRVLFINFAIAALCVLILVFCTQITGNTAAVSVDKFDGSVAEKIITFQTMGDSTDLSMTIPDNVPVTDVSIQVSTEDLGNGEYCEQPGIDFGPDNDFEWQFSGSGYGAFGNQYMFSTNNSRSTHTFTGAGSQSTTRVRMPKDATVSSAYMGINGRLNANLPTRTQAGTNAYALHGPAVADLNGDGAKDISTTEFYYSSGDVHWWKSSGGSNPSFSKTTLASNLYYPNDVDIGDINGDSNNDIVCAANRYGYSSYDGLIIFQNNGGLNPSFTRRNMVNSMGFSDVKIAKINGDNNNDIVASSYYDGLYWYQNNGGANPTFTKKTIDTGVSYADQVDVGDVDNDGDLDVVVVSYVYSSSGVWVYKNNNNGASWTKIQLDSGRKYGSDVQFSDIDQDGDLDVVATFYYDYMIKWYDNLDTTPIKGSGNGGNWKDYVITSSFMYAHGFDVLDIANDGYMDIFCTGYYGNSFYWYEAPDDPRSGSWTKFTVDNSLSYGWDCVVTDVTGDSVPEVIATSAYYSSGRLYRYSLSYSYPTNPSIQFGGTGSTDWSFPSTCQGQHMTGDLTAKIQSLMDSGAPITDGYGNKYVEFPIKVSLGSGGRITLEDLDIHYNLTVTVDKNPHNSNLKNEVNELVPDYGDGTTKVFLNVHSNSPGALKVSGLNLEYNAFPTQTATIPTFHVDEDSVTTELLDVRDYFEDDYASKDELVYAVHMSSSDMSKVRLTLMNNYYIKADCSQYPNWNGEVQAYISALDNGEEGLGVTGLRTTYSNTFKIVVDPVNDPPVVGSDYLTNIMLDEGGTYTTESLDDKKYFTDLENSKLYYKGVVDPENKYNGEEMTVSIDTYNRVVVTGLNDFHGMKVPVRIYCTDVPGDWTGAPFQDFTATVRQLMDDKPKWGYLEDIYMVEDTDLLEAVKLTEFVTSIDSPATALQFTIVYNVNGSQIFADIDDEGYLNLYASGRDYDGMTDIVIRASDGYNYADTFVKVIVEPVNDPPTGKIIEPSDLSQVPLGSRVMITGSSHDPESIKDVEVKIGATGDWVKASGAGSWQYNWEVEANKYSLGDRVQISMRVYDGEYHSPVYSVNVTVIPGASGLNPDDSDGDGVKNKDDKFPDNPFEWTDKDRDGVGDNEDDAFPDDPKEWDDTDHDGKGDNSDPFPYGEDRSPGSSTNDYVRQEESNSIFSLWWLVALLVVVEVFFIVFLMVKKLRSKRPSHSGKKQKKKAAQGPYAENKAEEEVKPED